MRPAIDWLFGELPRLIELGVVTPETADALRRHYGSPERQAARIHWGQMLLVSFGAILVGGGIILILAHNWDVLGRPARAAVALGLLAAAQALTMFAVARRSESTAWTESTAGLLVPAVGAAIALVGQTYHVGGSFEGLMRAWLWLAVPIPYLTGSCLAALEFWGLFIVRAGNVSWQPPPSDPWLLAAAAVPFVLLRIRRHPGSWSTALVAIAAGAALFFLGSVIAIESGWRGLWAVFQVSALGALIAAATWPVTGSREHSWRGRVWVPAWAALVVIGTILSFDDAWSRVTVTPAHLRTVNVVVAALVAVACAAVSSLASYRLAIAGHPALAATTAAPALAVFAHALAMRGIEDAGWMAFNLWLLAVGVLTLLEGVRGLKLGTANRGLVALALLVASRFFDSDLTFLARGLAFVTLGAACFALNLWLMRRLRTGAA